MSATSAGSRARRQKAERFHRGADLASTPTSAPMTESITAVVARTLSMIPVRASRHMTGTKYQVRVAEVPFDIESVGDETGVYYGGEGVELEDQPLLAAVRVLVGRRFDIPESLM